MLIEEALGQFVLQLQADGRSPHTVSQYRRHVRALARWAAEVGHGGHVEDLDHQAVARFMTAPWARVRPDGRNKRATSVNAQRSSLRCFFGYLHEVGVVAINAAQRLRRARCAPPPPRALSDEERDRLLAVLRDAKGPEARRDHLLVHLMLETGLRLGSAIGLDAEDVDLGDGSITVRTSKGDRPDRVFLSRNIRGHLAEYLVDRTPGPLFTGRGGQRISARHAQRRFALWLEKAAITRQASLHSLRHTFGTAVYRRTGDLLVTQQALRHRSIASTTVYARCDEGRLRAAVGA